MSEKILCPFDLFVRLKPENVTRFPNNSLTWCYRGDKYTTNHDEMLNCLLRMFLKHYQTYKIAIIRDNSYQANDPLRTVVKLCNGIVEDNRLIHYSETITKIHLPQWLQ